MSFDPEPAAALLAEAWRGGRQITALPPEIRPATLAEGYAVQDRLIAVLGEPCSGWKLGLGSRAQKRDLGIGRSVAGRVLAARCHGPDAVVPLPHAAPATIECEIAFRLARDVAPGAPPPPLRDLVAETCVTFEVVLSRFVDRRAAGWPSFAADDAGFEALVVGEAVDPEALAALAADLRVAVDGELRARALAGDDATDPAAALADLIAVAGERGLALRAGEIVSTGTVSRPFTVEGPAEIRADFLGRHLAFRTRPPGNPA
ncbi:2-keto-4-pentenoate hydratase [Methylobacterium sp. WSM2598]|uniref:2-keto-4-pentenoate hydratase n=1 Tax=Methylobacterium sp. WSM2598 TaxID=398261 RepID=UPI000382E466|nr:fumarylacetoacetate hydrolase family protein [Methylobacterium sp. WSM2598]